MPDTQRETLPAPTQPSDLDGWTSDDLEEWLPPAIRQTVLSEQQVDDMRVAVGLVLYRLRVAVGDGKYGEAVDRVARVAGVSAVTLGRWRTRAESHFQLPAPSARTVAQRERRQDERLTSPRDVSATPSPKAIEAPPTAPAPVVSPPAPSASPVLALPSKREDYRRLIALIVTAGPETLATSVERAELSKALGVLRSAVGAIDKTEHVDLRPGAATCECPKPAVSKFAPVCTICGRRRP